MSTKIPGFKVVGNKVVKDEAAIEAKLDVSTRIKRRTSQKIKFKRGGTDGQSS